MSIISSKCTPITSLLSIIPFKNNYLLIRLLSGENSFSDGGGTCNRKKESLLLIKAKYHITIICITLNYSLN